MIQRREPLEQEIACRAYELYLQRGGGHGRDVEDWVRAEEELKDERVVRSATATAALASRKTVN